MNDEETVEGSEQSSNKDQDSDVSFQEDQDEEIDKSEKEEEWIEFIKRSTKKAQENVKKMKIPCWLEPHRSLKLRIAMRIASLPEERWTSKIIEWNFGLDNKIKTNRSVGRPRKRWEDDINEFSRPEETEETKGNDLKKQLHLKDTREETKGMERNRRQICKSTVAISGSMS